MKIKKQYKIIKYPIVNFLMSILILSLNICIHNSFFCSFCSNIKLGSSPILFDKFTNVISSIYNIVYKKDILRSCAYEQTCIC